MHKQLIFLLTCFAVAGNSIFVVWILYNGGIEHGFNGTVYQQISTIGLLVFLTLNIILILSTKKENKPQLTLLRYAAISGNVFFILWMLFNGINEGFKATSAEKITYLSMFVLLAINSILLILGGHRKSLKNKI